MKLEQLIQHIEALEVIGNTDTEITGIAYDSRKVTPGSLFVCIKGFQSDGHLYTKSAVERGAAAIVCQEDVAGVSVPVIRVRNSRKALSRLSEAWYDFPSEKMKLIGITGTNGKTTCTYLMKGILENCGYKVGLIGTNQNMIGDEVLPAERTTPESLELSELLSQMAQKGCNYVVMEVSSHSLVLDRVGALHFDVAVLTNVTQDHLDFHKTMDAYADAKAKLFERCDTAVLNKDSAYFEKMAQKAGKTLTYGLSENCDLRADTIEINRNGVSFQVTAAEESYLSLLPIPGRFSVYNALAAIGAGMACGIPSGFIKMALKKQKGVKGRLEIVETGTDYTMIIDYAHAPDGLLNVLNTINEFKEKRVITLFGCGGDRDKTKRPVMGKIAGELSDYLIVTSDNPRTEEPAAILRDIEAGVRETDCPYEVIESRIDAIHRAMDMAEAGDIVLLAGKGHETYQILRDRTIHLDEREVIAEYLQG